MQKDLNDYKRSKLRKKRIIIISIVSILMAISAVFLRECNQSFDKPYNSGYQPKDQNSQQNRNPS